MADQLKPYRPPVTRLVEKGGNTITTHVFLCGGKACTKHLALDAGDQAWEALKEKSRQVDPILGQAQMYRTRVSCLRICTQGPILLAYPQGKWHQNVTADQVDGVVDHLLANDGTAHPLEFHTHPLKSK